MFTAHAVLCVKYTVHDLLQLSDLRGKLCHMGVNSVWHLWLLLLRSPSALVYGNLFLLSVELRV